jgi:hypothetical protein
VYERYKYQLDLETVDHFPVNFTSDKYKFITFALTKNGVYINGSLGELTASGYFFSNAMHFSS